MSEVLLPSQTALKDVVVDTAKGNSDKFTLQIALIAIPTVSGETIEVSLRDGDEETD